jgi:hypothetical protein
MSKKPPRSFNDDDYPIGYGRPPAHTRFQSGRSGNPKGRPKGSKSFSTLLAEELNQPVTLTENGKRKRMSKQQALAKQLTNKALNNDMKATALVIDQARRSEDSPEATVAISFERPEDELVIADIIRRIRMAEEPRSDSRMQQEESEEEK